MNQPIYFTRIWPQSRPRNRRANEKEKHKIECTIYRCHSLTALSLISVFISCPLNFKANSSSKTTVAMAAKKKRENKNWKGNKRIEKEEYVNEKYDDEIVERKNVRKRAKKKEVRRNKIHLSSASCRRGARGEKQFNRWMRKCSLFTLNQGMNKCQFY